MKTRLKNIIEENQRALEDSFSPHNLQVLEDITQALLKTLARGGKILVCGNGGSAADAQHFAAEFIGRFKKERKSLPAIALTTDTSVLTALANDYSYDLVFASQVEGLGAPGDALIAISTSGNSRNVLEAVKTASALGLVTISLTGGQGGQLKKLTTLNFTAASNNTPHIQEVHITALHAISELVEEELLVNAS